MSRERISRQKSARLASLREHSGEEFDFETDGIPTLRPSQNDDLFGLEEDFGTLRLSPQKQSSNRPPARQLNHKPSLSPGFMMQFVESEEDHLSFDKDFNENDLFNPGDVLRQNGSLVTPKAKFSPGTASNPSPLRRRSLSDYSEGTDTAMTSEMDDDDFEEEIDDIFGKEESGIYSSGGRSNSNPNGSRAGQILSNKKEQLQRQAEKEEAEMYERYKQSRHSEGAINTLKLKDLNQAMSNNQINQDPLENERTVNYEYTRDDNEAFEDGFDLEQPLDLEISKFHRPSLKKKSLAREMSMPNFPKSLESSRPTKYKSSMDLAAFTRKDHPVFNSSNEIIKRLNRMPSFHNQTGRSEPKNDDEINRDMELRKKELLEKYMEITEKQKKLNTSPQRNKTASREPTNKRKGVGLVKFLNNQDNAPAVNPNNKMKYNPMHKLWEGNEHDLMRFEEPESDHPGRKPGLIRKQDFQQRTEKIQGNMRYDAENLRWVNTEDDDKENEKIFEDVPDLEPNDIPQYTRPDLNFDIHGRGVSTFTQRTVSTTSSDRSSALGRQNVGNEFQLSTKNLSRFEKEEAKIKRKTHNWFAPKEQYRLNKERTFSGDYFWEIRKMVCEEN
ncbi:hypothetical protein FT663_04545 [Candidozyma haemuli var. vulneris]|nr:hypothetical protein FT662_04591 [[Candida] haemuloni var. vulneris]KAF3987238.1 hypothetical protein FT663_04545 [[Candida] haemuloni var. vulneris]